MRRLAPLVVMGMVGGLGLATAPAALAASAPGAVHGVGPGTAHIRSAPAIAVDPGNGATFSVAYTEEPSSGQPFRPRVATTFDSGQTWPVASTLPVPTGQQFVNTVALGAFGGGRLVAAYVGVGTYTLNGSKRQLDSVLTTTSSDSGRTWSAPAYVFQAQLTATGVCTASDSTRTTDVDIALDPRPALHRAYVAWLSDDGCTGQASRYHLARSNNYGRAWTLASAWAPEPFAASAQVLDLAPPHVTVGPSGYVYAGYTGVFSGPGLCAGAGDTASTSVMARSPDGGQTMLSALMLRSCDGFGVPRTAVDARTKALVAVLDNGNRVHVLRSVDGAASWQDPKATQPAPVAVVSPSLTVTPDGNVALLAVGGRTCHPQLFRSADDGKTWAAPKSVSTNVDSVCPQDTQTSIATGSNNVIHPVWAERAPLSQGSTLWTAERKSTAAV